MSPSWRCYATLAGQLCYVISAGQGRVIFGQTVLSSDLSYIK